MTRIAVIHDYLTQRGGAERVVLSIMRTFPTARLFTSVYNPDSTFPEFAQYDVSTTFLDQVGLFRRDPRWSAPMLPRAMRSLRLNQFDLVLCSSSGWAHHISADIPRIVYCYTPPRWLYRAEDYFMGRPVSAKLLSRPIRSQLIRLDRKAAWRADKYVAISSVVADRIRDAYAIEAEVLHPPVSLLPGRMISPFRAPIPPGFLLTVSRPRTYKRTSVVIAAAHRLKRHLVVVGPPQAGFASQYVTVLSGISDANLRWLYSHCFALVAASEEDFGLTPIEAAAFGKPSAVLKRGGYLDTVLDGVTGVFFEEPTVGEICAAVLQLAELAPDPTRLAQHVAAFSESRFGLRLHDLARELLRSRDG